MNVRVTVQSNRFRQLSAQARQRAAELVMNTARAIEADAMQRAPVVTGALRDSIVVDSTGELNAEITVGVEYGPVVELGHHTRSGSFVPAQPFLTPAAEAARGPFEAAARKLLD